MAPIGENADIVDIPLTLAEELEAAALAARVPVRPDSPTFAELGARAETVAALAAVGITRAFAIQEYALPIALRGNDLIGQAPTGTGKTLGFGIPLIDRVIAPSDGADGQPQALVVVPTRELGLQVARDLQAAGTTRGIRVLPVYGGVAYEPQVESLNRGVEIIVGTPGRLLDLTRPAKGKSKPYLRLDSVRALVLDEADRMLDLGFLDDVEKILAMLPENRQTMLFSATMPDPIVTLARRFLRQPITIHARHDIAASPLTKQVVYRTHPLNKVEIVARILQSEGRGLTMIFTRTKRAADRVSEDLDFRGFAVAAVHGDLGQSARERALRAFRNGKVDVLVATDVAARGLDVSGVTHVINYDCPEDPDTYTHRIGRTGRAGATGVAVTFVDWEDMPRWRIIDKTLGLDIAEPPETYHTSPHIFTDLLIDSGVSGTLPSADRTRAGLGAEVEEDLGGTRRAGSRDGGSGHGGSSRSGSGRSGSGPSGSGRNGLSRSDSGRNGSGRSGSGSDRDAPSGGRSRSRTSAPAVDATIESIVDDEPRVARTRRRRRGGATVNGPDTISGPDTVSPATPPIGAQKSAVDIDATTAEPQRRTRSRAKVGATTAVLFSAVEESAPPVAATSSRPRRTARVNGSRTTEAVAAAEPANGPVDSATIDPDAGGDSVRPPRRRRRTVGATDEVESA